MQTEAIIQRHTVTLRDEVQIEYFTAGEGNGRPVVLLHGGGTDHAMLSWRDTIPALLQAGCRVYIPNYPGYGGSPLRATHISLEKLVEILHQLMDIWSVEKAALAGISLGGALTSGYTLEHPERVERIILIGSYGLMDRAPYHTLSYFLVRMPWLMNALWAMARGSRLAARYSLNSIIFNPQSRTESLVDEVLAAMQNLDSQKAFGLWQQDELLWKGVKTNYTPRLSEIQSPALIIHGTKDIGVPLECARRAAACLPNARLEAIENGGHWTQRDHPELVNQLMVDFLTE